MTAEILSVSPGMSITNPSWHGVLQDVIFTVRDTNKHCHYPAGLAVLYGIPFLKCCMAVAAGWVPGPCMQACMQGRQDGRNDERRAMSHADPPRFWFHLLPTVCYAAPQRHYTAVSWVQAALQEWFRNLHCDQVTSFRAV